MTIEQAIEHAEEVALEQIRLMSRYDAASGYNRSGNESIRTESAKECEKCAEEHRQLAAWLRELQERREQPEIIRCKDCRHYEWMSNRIPEEQTWHCHCWDADTGKDDFCSYAERRTE